MPGRIRRSVEAAMGQVDNTAAVAAQIMLDAAERGVTLEIESIMGFKIPTTKIRIKLVDEPVADEAPVPDVQA